MKKNILLRGLGLRSVKTALSVFLCIPVLRLLGLDQPFFACIAAVVATQTTVRQSFAIGLERMVGTLAGAVWALIFTTLVPPPLDPGDLTLLHMLLIA
ncbi:MAG: aromatic acid exporter family protein, partial [Gracilibacteraceae bacterium]|nr:aromatic acid exporter family protein [Gracilibacteraceae bacterium]